MSKRLTSRDVACPTCGAGQGEKCRGSWYAGRSHRTVDYHSDRREQARQANAARLVADTEETGASNE